MPDTEHLLAAIARGDANARGQLLDRHRPRLKQMVAIRFDRRLAARLDPSDLVQETLVEADRRLEAYLQDRPLPFYPWLRQLALNRLIDARRFHVRAGRRTVTREEPAGLPESSVLQLADRLISKEAPSAGLRLQENRERVRAALDRLAEADREVLVLRYLEQMSAAEAGAVLGVGEGAMRVRVLRALRRLRAVMSEGERT
jgi:RNA polymerase sigma-70 factor (ECF subfamily)